MKDGGHKIPTYLILIVLVLLWLLPVWTTFLVSFKSSQDFMSQKFYQLPTKVSIVDNFRNVMKTYRLHEHFLNSLLYAVAGAGIAIAVSSMAGFSIVRLKPPLFFFLFLAVYSGTLFPFQMYLIPVYKFFNTLGLYNTRLGLILIYAAICTPFALFVYRGFYTTIPKDVEDAAKIDGAGPVRTYFSIFVPQSLAPTAVVALFQMTWIWNDLLFGMVLSRTQNIRPIMVALATMSGYGGGNIPYIMTGVIFTSVPTILLFVALQRYFISGMKLSVTAH
jgi:multiple sugar transport system permease protein